MAFINRNVCAVSRDNNTSSIAGAWIGHTKQVDGYAFIAVDKLDHKLKKYVSNDFSMINTLTTARNVETERLMCGLLADGDDLVDQEVIEQLPKRPRKEMLDDIASVITVHVADSNGTHYTVKVLPSANGRA
eukprot:2070487-Pyramimonas_sp.AAC.1